MIVDGISYEEYARRSNSRKQNKAIGTFLEFLEKRLGFRILYDRSRIPLGRPEAIDAFKFAELLKNAGIITLLKESAVLPDEPPYKLWYAICTDPQKSRVAGASVDSDESALYATLAEGLERYLWFTQTDYFVKPFQGTALDVAKVDAFVDPHAFVAFSEEQRAVSDELKLDDAAEYLWIQGRSLVSQSLKYLPAQTVSTAARPQNKREPMIRMRTTIGLATWLTQEGAELSGMLEVIEREAYMVMWFNQLTLPRVALTSLQGKSQTLDTLLERCARYRLKVHIVQMITDAPTHAFCAIIEDLSGLSPRFAFGLKAHRSPFYAAEHAILEALRARSGYRLFYASGEVWDVNTSVDAIGHRERMYYWGVPENAKRVEFLIKGPEVAYTPLGWESDTITTHRARVLAWCRQNNFECISVSLGHSKANPTKLHVEMVVMPDLQPTHLFEKYRHLGGMRLKSIPKLFGYVPREKPFIDAPHPFC